jgi:hypothetical protein
MDNKQAQHQIREIFQQPFQRAHYLHFLRNLLNQIEPRDAHYTGNLIPDSFKEHVTQYWRVGKYIDPDGIELDLLVVEVKSLTKLDRARSALRNFAVNRLKQFGKDCSLVAFYAKDDGGDDWRFSYVKIEHEAQQDDRGKIRIKAELTPAKRYSYLVGKHENSHTACQQLMPLLVMDYANPRIEEIEKAFSIEKVCNEEIYLLNSAYFMIPPTGYDSRYLLGILNSSVIHFYLQNNAETSGMGTTRWINNHVKDFPVPKPNTKEMHPISVFVSYLEYQFKRSSVNSLLVAFLEELVDGLVFGIYFTDEIKAAGKDILKHLGDLKPIIDDMSDEEKLAVIQSEFDRLYDPKHPVRNNLETLDSVEEVRIIRETLKR